MNLLDNVTQTDLLLTRQTTVDGFWYIKMLHNELLQGEQNMATISAFTVLLLICLIYFWFTQFLDLMGRRDDEFKGKHDKILWFLTIFFGNFVGAFCYFCDRQSMTPLHKQDPKMAKKLQGVLGEFVAKSKNENL